MFTQPSVNQIASAYKGNPAPLAQKVEQDRKQNGGVIPKDLRQLMASYDLAQGKQNAGIQAALNAPANMPTVAEDVQAKAQQALQARMVQEAQKQMAKDGRPGMIPMGVPQPRLQPEERGIDSLASNVGESYAMGGVVAFQEGGPPPDTRSADDILREQMRVNEETRRAEAVARQKAELGAPDTTQIDRLIAENQARKEKLAGPKPGYDAVMEMLDQIALGGGRTSAESGALGASRQKALQKAREAEQSTLTDKMIDLAQRKSDTGYQYKKDLFQTGNVAAEAAIKQKYDAAISVARTDQEKLKLAQEKDFELKKLDIERQKANAMSKPAEGIQVANMLMAADKTLSKEEALKRGYMISKSGELKQEQNETARLKALEDAEKDFLQIHDKDIRKMYATSKKPEVKAQYDAWVAERDTKLKELRARRYSSAESGGLPQALATQATPSAAPTAGGYTVTAGGMVHSFPTQAAADAFKKASGAK
jgi:hypothetical protein